MASVQREKQLIYLSSKYATKNNNTTSSMLSDLTFNLQNETIRKHKGKSLCVKLQQFTFANSFYIINSSNYKIVLTLTGDTDDRVFYLPEGNYTATEMIDLMLELRDQDDAIFPLEVEYDETDYKFRFFHPDTEFTFKEDCTCFGLIGFPEEESIAVQADDNSYNLISEYQINLSGMNTLYVAIPNLSISSINVVETTVNTGTLITGNYSKIICAVPVEETQGSYVYFNNYQGLEIFTKEEVITEFQIRIYEEDMTTLCDFQNQPWWMTIEVSVV